MEKSLQQIPNGMLFHDTLVAGAHPYQGGRLILSVVLCQVTRADYARSVLKLVETAAGALSFAAQLSTYLKIADVVLTGVETLFGKNDMEPLVGLRAEFNPDTGKPLTPGYYALIDMQESQVEADKLYVREGRLNYGESLATAQPYRQSDYVLYSIARSDTRSDTDTLPFYPIFEQVKQEASKGTSEAKESAKANMLSLWQQMALSPDLTIPQRNTLQNAYVAEMLEIYNEASRIQTLGGSEDDDTPPDVANNMSESLKILQL